MSNERHPGRQVGFKMTTAMKERNGEIHRRHGMTYTPTWNSWRSMLQRCGNPNNHKYPLYGGRGIFVCAEWVVFENFLADMGVRPDGTTLDRIDPEGHYEPSNCRWADKFVQRLNRRANTKTTCPNCGNAFRTALHFHMAHCKGVAS